MNAIPQVAFHRLDVVEAGAPDWQFRHLVSRTVYFVVVFSRHTLHVPPRFAQLPQDEQFLQALH